MMNDHARKYRQQQILNASPAQQVVMLYDGAIGFCMKAKAAIGEGNIQERHNANRRAMEIVNYLLEILDLEKGGDVARRLYMIYTQLIRKLMDVDFKNDPRICDDVAENLRTLRASWAEIAQQGLQGGTAQAGGAPGPEQAKVVRAGTDEKPEYKPFVSVA